MNNIFTTAAKAFADACACGTDFHRENSAQLYTR